VFLWYALKKMGVKGLQERYKNCLEVAQYCKNKLNGLGIPAWRNPGSITVVFPKVNSRLKEKWQLATDDVTHIICMPSVSKAQIDEFIEDMIAIQQEPEANPISELDFWYN
jgi:histidine decarboxylase